MRERQARKNNILIVGLHLLANNQKELKEAVEDFFANEVEVPTKVVNVSLLARSVYVVTVANFANKITILKNIHKMIEKKTRVKMFPDLTARERRIHELIVAKAEEERDKGNHATVGHMRLYINRKMYMWNEQKDKLEPVTISPGAL